MSEKKEYIERGALKDKFRIPDRESVFNLVIAKTPTIEAANIATDMIIEIAGALRNAVDDEPAADVEPVARGEWIESKIKHCNAYYQDGFRYTSMYTCSSCGRKSKTKHERCLHCFAHMERSGGGE